jgi:L-histidine N-alpha-methyltransferase
MKDFHQIGKFTLRNYLSDIDPDEVTSTILRGLTAPQKRISSIHFYDAVGSRLFEEITRLPEYYPTRTEKRLLQRFAPRFSDGNGRLDIIEIGSGDCSKISILLTAIPSRRWPATCYTPLDASRAAIRGAADCLRKKFPGIEIRGMVADFTRQMHLVPGGRKRFFCFLGGTIGNLTREQSRSFFLDLRRTMGPGDALLLGVDMVKPVEILEKAYNDSRGVTATFNRNILKVVNQLIGTDFDPLAFDHLAYYNHHRNRIEMHLKATADMRISCPAHPEKILIRKDETIHTENSHKYTRADIRALAATAGLAIKNTFTDENHWFSLMYLVKN